VVRDNQVHITGMKPTPAMEMVRELRARGLVQGTDFDFMYLPKQFDEGVINIIQEEGVSFFFKEGKWATFFRIKYGTN